VDRGSNIAARCLGHLWAWAKDSGLRLFVIPGDSRGIPRELP
jgi:hypothetical protein